MMLTSNNFERSKKTGSMRRVAKYIRKKFSSEDHFNATEGITTRPPVVIRQSNLEDDYTICEELGRGKFGLVKRIKRISTNEQFAAKWIKINDKTKNNVLEEIKIMEKLDNKRVIKLHNVYETSKSYILVMEFVTGGELFERIASEETVTEKECVHYMRQLLEGLQYIHRMNIAHLDLKPENIVCVSKYSWNIKLIDFGLAKELKPGTIVKTMQGTPEFVAPEVINYDPIHLASDMWSVGVMAYLLVSGLSPFLGDDDKDTLANVTAGTYDFEDEAFMSVGHEVKDFIEKLLQKSPRKRKTAEECLKHEWIKKNKGKGRISTENLRKFLVQKRWQKSVNAVRAVRNFSSINSFSNIGTKTKSQSVLKLNVEATFSAKPRPLSERNRDLSRSVPSVFSIDEGQFNKRAMMILESDNEESEMGSTETVDGNNVDDKEVLEGLFKGNKDILEFLSPGLTNNSEQRSSEGPDIPAKAEFLQALSPLYEVPKGTSVLMTCKINGNPLPAVTWYKRDKKLTNDDENIKIYNEGNEHTLSIIQCKVRDEGDYSCVIQNEHGKTTSSSKLEVQVSPSFIRKIHDITVEEGKCVQFDVEISGRPLPVVQWYHEETLLQENSSIKFCKDETNNVFSLLIRSVNVDKRGVYKCVIRNSLESISCTACLHIKVYEERQKNNILEINSKTQVEENRYEDDDVSLRQDSIKMYYDIKEEIGKGRFAVVNLAIHKKTGFKYALKYIKVRKSQRDQFQHEIDIMNRLRHRKFFICLYDAFEEPRKLMLVLELMLGGHLLERLCEKPFLSEYEITRYVWQILEAVKDMHDANIVNLDLKPQNIMFTTKESNTIKLVDFGLARRLNADKDLKILFGTPEFAAPEVVNYELISPATDMWSIGVIAYLILTGMSPFWNENHDITISNVTQGLWKMPEIFFRDVSYEAKDFLCKLIVKDPSKRMKIKEAFQHPWIEAAKDEERSKQRKISTERLKKYHAHQKGLISSSVITSEQMKFETHVKYPQETRSEHETNKIKTTQNEQKKASEVILKLSGEKDDLNTRLKEISQKCKRLEQELSLLKIENKEKDENLKRLEKRNKILEDRNIANQEATQRMVRLECEKQDIEDKYRQKDKKLKELNKEYENVREKAASYDFLEEKVLHLERERQMSDSQCKKVEKQLTQLREVNEVLKSENLVMKRRSMLLEEMEEELGKQNDKTMQIQSNDDQNYVKDLQEKVEVSSKELEIYKSEIQRLNTTVMSQLEDLEEMERIGQHKKTLERRCKALEEQLVELEHDGIERENDIDEMEEDIADLQEKLEISHKKLRTLMEENKALKKKLEDYERSLGINMVYDGHHDETDNGKGSNIDKIKHDNEMNGELRSPQNTEDSSNNSLHIMYDVPEPPATINDQKISKEDLDDLNLSKEDTEFSAKYHQIEREIQELWNRAKGDEK